MDQRPNQPKPVKKEDGCKIRIKNMKNGGREISFSGNCNKNELRIAQGHIEDAIDED